MLSNLPSERLPGCGLLGIVRPRHAHAVAQFAEKRSEFGNDLPRLSLCQPGLSRGAVDRRNAKMSGEAVEGVLDRFDEF